VLATSPQKPPTTYTQVNDFRPHRTRFLGGDLYVGATYTRVYMVGNLYIMLTENNIKCTTQCTQ